MFCETKQYSYTILKRRKKKPTTAYQEVCQPQDNLRINAVLIHGQSISL